MAQFGNLFITNSGANLLSKVISGGTLAFTRVSLGDGEWLNGGVNDPSLQDIYNERITIGIQAVADIGNGMANMSVTLLYENLIADGFYGREIGIFANDPDDGEILFSAAYSGDLSDWIPSSSEVPTYEHIFNLGIAIGNATEVTVEVDQSVVFATKQELSDHTSRTDNPHEVSTTQIGAETPSGAQAKVDAHAALTNNPHSVTAAQVGAETPLGAQSKVDVHASRTDNPHEVSTTQIGAETPSGAQAKVDAHANRTDNPHSVSPAQIGAATPEDIAAHTLDTNNPHSVTPEQIGAATTGDLSGHTSNTSNPHSVTTTQIGAETPSGSQAKVDAHAALTNNPHSVTAAQVGAETPSGAQSKIDAAISALLDSAPGTLDTLNELAAALGDDPNFATTIMNAIAAKLDTTTFTSHTSDQSEGVHGASVTPTAGTISIRDTDGKLRIGYATHSYHAVGLGQFLSGSNSSGVFYRNPGTAGMIIQCITTTSNEDTWADRTFPMAFPHECAVVVISGSAGVFATNTEIQARKSPTSPLTTFQVAGNAYNSNEVMVIAIGD